MYTWILIKKEDGKYLGWSKAVGIPACGEPDVLEWVEWNKALPIGIDDIETYYKSGTLYDSDGNEIPLPEEVSDEETPSEN